MNTSENIKIERKRLPRSKIGLGTFIKIRKRSEDEGCSFGKAVEIMAKESRGGLNAKRFNCDIEKSTMTLYLSDSRMSVSLIEDIQSLADLMHISFGKALELMVSGSCKDPKIKNSKTIDRSKSKYSRSYMPSATVLPEVVDVLNEWVQEEEIPVGRAIDRMALESSTFNRYFEKMKKDPDWIYN